MAILQNVRTFKNRSTGFVNTEGYQLGFFWKTLKRGGEGEREGGERERERVSERERERGGVETETERQRDRGRKRGNGVDSKASYKLINVYCYMTIELAKYPDLSLSNLILHAPKLWVHKRCIYNFRHNETYAVITSIDYPGSALWRHRLSHTFSPGRRMGFSLRQKLCIRTDSGRIHNYLIAIPSGNLTDSQYTS